MPWAERTDDEPIVVGRYVQVRHVGNVSVLCTVQVPVRRLARQDALGLRVELAALESMGIVSQSDVAASGLVAEATFHRDCVAHHKGGDAAVRSRARRGTKAPTKLDADALAEIKRLHELGRSNVQVAAKLAMSEGSVRKGLLRLGIAPARAMTQQELAGVGDHAAVVTAEDAADGPVVEVQAELGGASELLVAAAEALECQGEEEAEAAPDAKPASEQAGSDGSRRIEVGSEIVVGSPQSASGDAGAERETAVCQVQATLAREAIDADDLARRIADRREAEQLLARTGLLREQSVLFPPTARAHYAGVLLGLALLSMTGLLREARQHLQALPNALYGLRAVMTTLIAMALLRCKRPEQLKGFDPSALGAVLGLARVPEMKTLRNKLALLATDQKPHTPTTDEKPQTSNEKGVVTLVRAMARRHVERLKSAVAFLYVDGHVRPYFGDKTLGKAHHTTMRIALPATTDYWVCDANGSPLLVMITEGNTAMTKQMPSLLDEVRSVVGPDVRPTVVFDRGGFCHKLFALITKRKFDFITYRKGKHRNFPRKGFIEMPIRRGGREVPTRVYDTRIRIKELGLVRCVAVLRPDGRQTHVLTTRTDLTAREVLERMFRRWQQENFFNYASEQYAFDALWTYDGVEADPKRSVPNPERRNLGQRIDEARRAIARSTEALGNVTRSSHPFDPNRRAQDLAAQAAAARATAEAEKRLATLLQRRRSVPARVPIGSLRSEQVLELARAPMLLGDVVKMTAYHIETMLLTALAPHLERADEEGRAVVADIMHLDGRIEPQGDVVHVTLAQASAPRYTRALRALCERVNEQAPKFPGTSIRLRFAVAGA